MTRLRRAGGYIDPMMSVLPLAFLAIVFGVPGILRALGSAPPASTGPWLRLVVVAGVLLVLQIVAIMISLEEAHHDGYSGRERGGLNRAPAIRGVLAPTALAVTYVIGIWPLVRIEPRRSWLIGLYAGLAIALVLSGVLAEQGGRAKRAREAGSGGRS